MTSVQLGARTGRRRPEVAAIIRAYASAMNTLMTALACLVASASLAAAEPPPPALSANGAFFALSVADIHASGTWYSEKLGLKVTMPAQRIGPGEVMVLEGGGLIVELIRLDEGKPRATLTPPVDDVVKIHGFFKAGVLVDDLDSTLAMLKARGVPIVHGPYAAKDGRRANFIIGDNAGNLIHFFGKK